MGVGRSGSRYTAAMPPPAAPETPGHPGATPALARLFVLIILVEIVTVAGLYWFGRHFGHS
jgi:hypothetical protein